jgi:2'-5' RNA ligase
MINRNHAVPTPSAIRQLMHERYHRIWAASSGRIRTGDIESDPVLAAREADRRRGLTVIARPSVAVRQRVGTFLAELRALEPETYCYTPASFHVTVLSLFTATVEPGPHYAQTERYLDAANAALRHPPTITIEFTGITASPGAVMIQGFPDSSALNDLRDALRHELHARGLGDGLDSRYQLETAHMTVLRFRAPLRDPTGFAAALDRARDRPFGTTRLRQVVLVRNDWYMTRRVVETVRRYRLRTASGNASSLPDRAMAQARVKPI